MLEIVSFFVGLYLEVLYSSSFVGMQSQKNPPSEITMVKFWNYIEEYVYDFEDQNCLEYGKGDC